MESIGALYSRASSHIFGDWNACGKVMGLAPWHKRWGERDDAEFTKIMSGKIYEENGKRQKNRELNGTLTERNHESSSASVWENIMSSVIVSTGTASSLINGRTSTHRPKSSHTTGRPRPRSCQSNFCSKLSLRTQLAIAKEDSMCTYAE